MANRVSESSTSSTCFPCAAKNSATVVAARAALMRSNGDWSDVETTTTDRERPCSPSASSRNSPTSRPRSPTSPTTVTSASVLRVIMPISVLLPTPDPPKIPTRWPSPVVSSASTTRMPVPSGVLIGALSSGDRTRPSRMKPAVRAARGRHRSARPARSIPGPSALAPPRFPDGPRAPKPGLHNEFPRLSPPASRVGAHPGSRSPLPGAAGQTGR